MSDEPTRILLVEDNRGDARLLREALGDARNAQFELVHVERLSEALKRLGEERFDVVLLDLSLPDGQGLDTVVRAHRQAKAVPVVVLTGLDDEAMAINALREGAEDYLVKGQIDSHLLVRALRYAVERNSAREEIERHLERITALREINLATTSTLDLKGVLDVLLEKIDRLLPYSVATVRLFSQETQRLEPVACLNLDEREWKAEEWRSGRGIPNVVFETKVPCQISNVQTDPRTRDPGFFRRHGLVSYLGVPLIAKGEILGVLGFYTKEEQEFSDKEAEFLVTLAGQAAIAIQNAQLYAEVVHLVGDLARSNKVKSEFLSVMSHELRTPLTAVLGYAGMMQDKLLGEINAEQERALGMILSQSDDLLAVINSMLVATQLEAEALKLEKHEINPRGFLEDLKSAYAVPLNKDLSIVWDYPHHLPMLSTDSGKLKQILQNLINNAIKFTDQGPITISARHFSTTGEIAFKVADTGIGIPKESQQAIFEMFHQLDNSDTRNHGGVGLGLYIVKRFTAFLGGRIELESEPGKGSTFTVTFPLSPNQG